MEWKWFCILFHDSSLPLLTTIRHHNRPLAWVGRSEVQEKKEMIRLSYSSWLDEHSGACGCNYKRCVSLLPSFTFTVLSVLLCVYASSIPGAASLKSLQHDNDSLHCLKILVQLLFFNDAYEPLFPLLYSFCENKWSILLATSFVKIQNTSRIGIITAAKWKGERERENEMSEGKEKGHDSVWTHQP